jgi:hypothetical protein
VDRLDFAPGEVPPRALVRAMASARSVLLLVPAPSTIPTRAHDDRLELQQRIHCAVFAGQMVGAVAAIVDRHHSGNTRQNLHRTFVRTRKPCRLRPPLPGSHEV